MSTPEKSEGLTAAEATEKLRTNGPNELSTSRPLSAGRLLLDVISEPMFLLLVACGAIYLVLGDRNEALSRSSADCSTGEPRRSTSAEDGPK